MMTPTKKRKQLDSTIAEIHRTRERISDAFNGDIAAITNDAQRRQEQSNRRTVSYAETPSQAVNHAG